MKNKASQCLGMRRYVALRGEYGFKITENFIKLVTTDKRDYRFSRNFFAEKFFRSEDTRGSMTTRLTRQIPLHLISLRSSDFIYAGFFGVGNSCLPFSISRTSAMEGRSFLLCWMHSSPTCTHLLISIPGDPSINDGSNNSSVSPASQASQT